MKHPLLLATLLATSSAFAQTTIDQNKALAGGITPGDTAGFPITLSQPGSYKLTGNLNVPADVFGILITAENVTLDLNGFTVRGPGSCTRNAGTKEVVCTQQTNANAAGILATQKDVAVRNGMVRGFAGHGVWLQQSGSAEQLHVSQNAGNGLTLVRGHARDIESDTNGFNGISGSGLLTTGSVARNNGSIGISGGYVQESLASGNYTYGMYGRLRATVAYDNGTADYYPGSTSMGNNLASNGAY
ncbi:hypothetical protein [Roseateles sp.]|uniref:hypothetical protein n=1 Tax=Roseateles sp. TaxID=1971397 RepID=UPI0039E9DA8B